MVGGICTAHYRATLVKIIPYPMVDWHNAARVADTDAYKLALLICLLPQTVNFYATYHIRQWRYDYRLRLLWLRLYLSVRSRMSVQFFNDIVRSETLADFGSDKRMVAFPIDKGFHLLLRGFVPKDFHFCASIFHPLYKGGDIEDSGIAQHILCNLPNLDFAPFRATQFFGVERKTVGSHCEIVTLGNVKTHRLVSVTVCRRFSIAVSIDGFATAYRLRRLMLQSHSRTPFLFVLETAFWRMCCKTWISSTT